ncbi:YhjD/YihY/BrkB family envelope integrity protein [Acidovorax sp. CCYZU-2555]|uniref:YihY family inner membrane protein n=1 Tax=Acidovorax sp. CCYZU-2555 TaxID=2835042 RepID=UPI001BD06981|nr:YhjD/YihY/BrkB family envelope integrity protein [Acidovorax sp. CCYZU-2555]MBS7776458.1 YihY family inner membrane protein [Acidovorax sp. CCYZU-2555]
MALSFHRARMRGRQLAHTLSVFPWRNTAHTLAARFREDRLGLTASSLTFTSLLALVPFVTVALAVFTAFPTFGRLQLMLQRWLIDSLIPDSIALQVMDYLMQFAAKASQLGGVGFGFLLVTVISLVMTMDRTLNNIWRVQQMRPLGQRLLIYWAVITLGPLLMGGSIATTSYVLSASRGIVAALPEAVQVGFNSLEFLLLSGAMAALYHYVPNTPVKWRHAFVGGLFVAIGMALAKNVLALYLASVPTYSVIYGTFATLPILLIWVYVAWVIFLLGAVVTAYLPSLLAGMERSSSHPGWSFELALEVVAVLDEQRAQPPRGMQPLALARRLKVDALQLEPALSALIAVRWLGMLPDEGQMRTLGDVEPRYVLLCDPDNTLLAPLLQHLLLDKTPGTQQLWEQGHWDELTLGQALPLPEVLAQPPALTPFVLPR